MRRAVVCLAIAALLAIVTSGVMAQQPASGAKGAKASKRVAPPVTQPATPPAGPATAPSAAREADEKAIRLAADAFGKAYNAHDAKAIAQLFAAEAELVNEAGESVQGRAAIEKVFAGIFAGEPESKISVAIKSIRFLGPALAVEEGSTTTVAGPGEPAERGRYSVVHTRQDGKWLMASARDLSDDSPESNLEPLAFLVGEWVDESPDGLTTTSTRWTDDHHFLLSDFTIQIAGRPAMQGSQRIGWDPLAKVIRSWVFDSEGGFAGGVYSRQGNQWTVKLNGVTRDGKPATATNIITPVAPGRIAWQSRDRTVGGEAQGQVDNFVVVRKPPSPQSASNNNSKSGN